MESLSLDLSNVYEFIRPEELEMMENPVENALSLLHSQSGPGKDFLGWHDLPINYNKSEFARILQASAKIRESSEIVIVIGIGGSYLGSKAAIEFLCHTFSDVIANQSGLPAVYFAGTNMSGKYQSNLLDLIKDKEFSLIVISKSGTTTEPAIAFRVLKKIMEERFGKEKSGERIFTITDKEKGALKILSDKEDFESFIIPDDVGGRFSVLTPVGLLPMACAGIDINEIICGAVQARLDCMRPFRENPASQYAALRNILYNKGKLIEILVSYEPSCNSLTEWWKQLFGESEGKDGKGIYPSSANFTTDLHSLGQYIQDGRRHLFETILSIEKDQFPVYLEKDELNLDGLNYLAGKSIDTINKKAIEGTIEAHVKGGVPNIVIRLPEASAWQLGYLFYFFEKACAVSAYLLGVNPFDQPGVEFYKNNMFRLLGKPE